MCEMIIDKGVTMMKEYFSPELDVIKLELDEELNGAGLDTSFGDGEDEGL